MKLFINLTVAIAALITTIDAARFQLQPKSLAEVQSDDLQILTYLFKNILPAFRKSIETGEPLQRKEVGPLILNAFGSNFLSLISKGADPDNDSEGAALMKGFKKVLSHLSRALLGGIRTRKEHIDNNLSLLKVLDRLLSAATKKINPDDYFYFLIVQGFKKLLSLYSL